MNMNTRSSSSSSTLSSSSSSSSKTKSILPSSSQIKSTPQQSISQLIPKSKSFSPTSEHVTSLEEDQDVITSSDPIPSNSSLLVPTNSPTISPGTNINKSPRQDLISSSSNTPGTNTIITQQASHTANIQASYEKRIAELENMLINSEKENQAIRQHLQYINDNTNNINNNNNNNFNNNNNNNNTDNYNINNNNNKDYNKNNNNIKSEKGSLKQTFQQPFQSTNPDNHDDIVEIGPDQYEVKSLLRRRVKNNDIQYLVWWKGYSKSEANWVSESKLDCPQALASFYARKNKSKKFIDNDDEYTNESDDEQKYYLPQSSTLLPELSIHRTNIKSSTNNENNNYNNYNNNNNNNNNNNFVKSETKSKSEIVTNIKVKHHNDDPDSDDSDDPDDSGDEVSYSKERNNPLEYMIPHLKLREKLFPISKTDNQYLYRDRYTLLDTEWRMSEIYRFGFLVGFNAYLYPSIYKRYYDCLRVSRGLEPLWYPKIRVGSVQENKLPDFVMTYASEDINKKGRMEKGDIDLNDKSVTLSELPSLLRKHPPNWITYKSIHDPPSFTKLAMDHIDNEIVEAEVKRRDALLSLKAKRAASLYGEVIPKLEQEDIIYTHTHMNNQYDNGYTPHVSHSNLNVLPHKHDYKHEFIKQEMKRDNLPGQSTAEQNDIFKNVLAELSMDTRAAVILEINKRKYVSEDNRFADKSILKKPPAPKEPFHGRDMSQAPNILNYILVNIAKYDFNIGESFSLIETSLSGDALTWFNHQYSDIFSHPHQHQLFRFVTLFKNQYMNRAMATIYENQLRRCTLQQENVHSVDNHFNIFMKISGNWRACDHTILDDKLVHIYFKSLPENTQRAIGVSTLYTCKTVSEMYNIVKQTAIMINKPQRVINRDVVNINSMHLKHQNHSHHDTYQSYQHSYVSDTNSNDESEYDSGNDSDINDASINVSQEIDYNYTYPSDNEYYFNNYDINIDDIYFNTAQVTKDYYARDWKCFHCGDRGHRAGWFCPLVRQQKPQTGRGAEMYAEYQKKYAKDIYPYNITDILKREKAFWEKRGKDIRELVHIKMKQNVTGNRNISSKGDRYLSNTRSNIGNKSKPINNHAGISLRDKIRSHRDKIKNKNKDITDLSNDNDIPTNINDSNDDVQEIHNNQMYVDDELPFDYVHSDAFSDDLSNYQMHLYSIHDNIEQQSINGKEEIAIINRLASLEKQYAHPLLVQVELNGVTRNVLLDHGATRNLCRRSTLEMCYPNIFQQSLSNKCALISSSGTVMPITTRVKLTVRISNNEYQDALFYVVNDTPTKDIITSFVLGRTFLNMSGLCYDYTTDTLFDKNDMSKVYMKISNGKIVTKEQGESKSEIIPLCSFVTNNDTYTNIDTCRYNNMLCDIKGGKDLRTNPTNRKVMITSKKVTNIKQKVINNHKKVSNSNITCNNKKKNDEHRNKVRKRYNSIKQMYEVNKSKHDNIITAVHSHLDNNNSLTNDMKAIIYNHISTHINDYDMISENLYQSYIMFNNIHVNDKINMNNEKKARLGVYLNAYAKSSDNNKESDLLLDQVLKTLNEKEDIHEDEDPIMKNINDINELAAPSKQHDTNHVLKQKYDKVDNMMKELVHLNDNQRQQLQSVIHEYIDVYSLSGENFKQTDVVQHEINLEPDTKPFHQRLRVYSPALQQIIETEVNKMLHDKIIVKSNSPFASNLLLVRKPDPTSPGGIKNRVCVNFIQLNKLTIKDRYPLPNQEDIFRQIGSAKYFTTMDLMSGFWQIAIKPEHKHKTAFITTRGLYEFIVMPFGLCNAPSTFQRMMDKIILPEYRSFIQTYIDDIILFSKSFDDHLQHMKTLHKLLRKNKLTVKLSKCHFSQTSVKFLGHVLSQGEIKPNPEKIEAIKQWKQPNDVGAIRSFLGVVGWYRKFIPHFAEVAVPLVRLTRKNTKFIFNEECIKSFNILRDALMKAPILKQADSNKSYILETDASNVALGAVLLQKDDNDDIHPIAYASKTMNPAQQNYSPSEKECLALIWALEHFNTYCEGHEYTCLTDHRALTYLVSNKESNNHRITRWILRLQPYNLKVEYIKGTNNKTADLLSRPYMMKTHVNHIEVIESDDYVYFNGSRDSKRKSTRAKKQLKVYDVEAILAKRKIHDDSNEYEYLVKWKNYDETQSTWEPIGNLDQVINLVLEFENKHHDKHQNNFHDNNKHEQYECKECSKMFSSEHEYYIHQYKDHNILLPKLDSELGIIDEIDDTLLSTYQNKDNSLKYIYNSELGTKLDDITNNHEKKDLINHDFFKNEQNVLYCVDTSSSSHKLRLVVPKSLRLKLISEIHDGVMSTHPGIAHTCKRISEVAWWPHWRSDVIRYIMNCDKCLRAKRRHVINQLPRPVNVPSRPFQHIGVDVVGPFPTSQNGNVYILTVIDHFTRWAEAIPMTEQTTKYIANVIIKNIICRHGLFDVMTSDNGSVFVSELASYIYKELGIKRHRTTPHHPQSNGLPERFNGTLKQMLKIWCNEEQDNWDEYLPYAMFAYNTSYHTLLQETPFFLQHGRDPKLLSDIIINKQDDTYENIHDYGQQLVEKLKSVYDRIKNIYTKINEKRKQALENVKESEYKIGDQVLLYDPTTKVGLSRKLTIRWKGPYKIIQKRNDINYVIDVHGKMSLVNKHRLRPYVEKSNNEPIYANDITLLQEEVDRISELEIELRSKKEYKKQQLEIARANQDINQVNEVQPVNVSPNVEINQEVLDENESDIQANTFVLNFQW